MAAKDGSEPACIACFTGQPGELVIDDTSVNWIDKWLDELRKAPLGGGAVR